MDPDAVWNGEWGQLRDGCIRWDGWSSKGRGSFGGEFGSSYCNQWGLCNAALPKMLWAGLVMQHLAKFKLVLFFHLISR